MKSKDFVPIEAKKIGLATCKHESTVTFWKIEGAWKSTDWWKIRDILGYSWREE